jgi:hypothetical protein
MLLDVDAAPAVVAAAQEAEAKRRRLVALAHVPICTFTTRLVRAATSGWSTAWHWLHHIAVRTAVHNVVLVSERLHRNPPATTAQGLPHMPPELWLVIARFFRRSDWSVVGGAVHPVPDDP